MNWNKILFIGLVCGLVASTFNAAWGTNQYFFDPETLRVEAGEAFEWHLMMENDFEVYAYQVWLIAPHEVATIFDPDTMTVNWNGTAAFFLEARSSDFDPTHDLLMASAWNLWLDGVSPGTDIAMKLQASISDTAPNGLYHFSGMGGQCWFEDEWNNTYQVNTGWGYIEVYKYECGDVNLDGRVTFADALYLKNYYYQTPPGSPPPCEPPKAGPFGERRMRR